MAVNLSPIWGAGAQLFDNSGNVLTGGKIYTYAAGTTTPATTYTSSSGITANSNPIILNSAGRVPYEIWLSDTVAYKFVLKDSNDTLIATYDNLVGINSNLIAYTAQQEIQTATAGQTVFNLTTMQYQPGTNNLSVFVDGVNQYGPGAQYAYVETDSDTVTFVSGLHVGASVKFTTASPVAGAVANAENVAYDPPFTGAVGTNVEAKLAQTVSVKDFGAVGDGVTDDTAAIQDAIDAIGGLTSGGTVYFPAGSYYVTDTLEILNNKVYLQGAGTGNTIITRNTDYGNTIYIHGDNTSGARVNDVGISQLSFYSTGLTTSGAHIYGNGVNRMTVNSIYMQDGFIGMLMAGVVASTVNDVYMVFTNLFGGSITNRRYMYFGNSTGAYSHPGCGDVFVSNFNIRGNTTYQITDYGIQIVSGDGIWFENGHVGNCKSANISINAATSENLTLIWFSNVMSDEGLGYGLQIAGNTPSLFQNLQFSNCIFNSGGSPAYADIGVIVAAGCDVQKVQFVNCIISEYGSQGVYLNSTASRDFDFTACIVTNNGRDSVGTFPGYYFASGVQKTRITGGRSGSETGLITQGYGIEIAGINVDLIVTGVDLTGNTVKSVNGYSVLAHFSNCSLEGSYTVSSASLITPASGHNFTKVSGTTNIILVRDAPDGTILTLLFENTLTVKDAVAGGNLSLAGDFTTNANDTLTLMHIGGGWQELSRSAN